MKKVFLFALVAILLGCRDPFDYQHHDPGNPDPPGAPILVSPKDGANMGYEGFPRDVAFEWNPVAGASFFQLEVYTDSVPVAQNLHTFRDQIAALGVTVTFPRYGFYYWRVRAASPRRWNNYTDWSGLRWFVIPNPTR